MVRQATKNDIKQMEELMLLSFGNRPDATSYREQTDRYVVYEQAGKLIGMTGIIYSEEYKALEIAWTCTHPDHRGKGIMHELFKHLLENETRRVYCSCWHLSNKEHINLYWLMKDFNFKPLLEPRVSFINGHNCHHNNTDNLCVNYCDNCCKCSEDLYIRE